MRWTITIVPMVALAACSPAAGAFAPYNAPTGWE